MTARRVLMTCTAHYRGEYLLPGTRPELPGAVADRVIGRGQAVEIEAEGDAAAEGQAPAPVAPPAKRSRSPKNRGADAVIDAPAADPGAALPSAPVGQPDAAAAQSDAPAGDGLPDLVAEADDAGAGA